MKISYNKLWKLLIDNHMKKIQLREKAGITTNSMTKLNNNESVQLSILVKICEVLNCDIGDIVEVIDEV